jgi:hypothetical protein
MSVISLAPHTSKATSASMSYLDLLPDDVLSIIYAQVIADTTADIETEVALLEANMSIIVNRHYAYTNNWTFYMMKMMTPYNDNIHPIHAVYDGFLHINPNINLTRRITAERIKVRIANVWDVTIHTRETGLAGTRPTTLSWDITKEFHGEDPVTNFTIIDEIMRYALAHDISLNNEGWKHNCIHHISIINPGDDDDDDDDDEVDEVAINNTDYTAEDGETVTVYVDLYKSWMYGGARMFERTHEQSCLTNFDDDFD